LNIFIIAFSILFFGLKVESVVALLRNEKMQIEEMLGTIQEKVTALELNHAEAISENSSLQQSLITNEDHLKLAAERFQKMKSDYNEVVDTFYLNFPFGIINFNFINVFSRL